jgi:uncharacterized protein YggE
MLKQMRWSCIAALMFFGLPLTGNAQYESGGINGAGSAEIAHPANCLRMQVEVTADGKTIQEAIAALKTRRESLKTQLVQIGAVQDSITFAEPRLFTDQSDQSRRMEQMMRQRMNGGKAAAAAKQDEIVKVATTAKAEWMLKGTPDELLTQSFQLKKQLEQTLKPAKSAAGPTTAAAEAAEEADEEGATPPGFPSGYDNGEVKPGTPIFLYVSKVTPEEREKALTTAFNKAHDNAAQAAKAAGVQLGSLRQLSQQSTSNMNNMGYYGNGMNRMMYQMMRGDESEAGASAGSEAVGMDVSSVKLIVMVNAMWSIGK